MGQYYPGPSRPMRECSPVRKPPPAARVPKIEILQIPYDNPEMYLLRVPLHVIDAKSTKYTPLEHTLGHVPNLWGKDAKPFEWRDRSLTIIPATEIDPNCEYDYFMYKSKNKQVGPKANGYFDQFDGAGIDGDVFVFRMESDSFDGPTGRAEYVDMENDFVQSLYDMYEGAIGIVTRLAELKKPGTSQGKS